MIRLLLLTVILALAPIEAPEPELIPIEAKMSFYCSPCNICCPGSSGLTASGIIPIAGVTVSNDVLPFGTKIYRGEEPPWIVQDRFGGNNPIERFDVFVGSGPEAHQRALEMGRQTWTVFVESK